MKKVCLMIAVAGLGGCSSAWIAERQCQKLGVYQGDAEFWNCIDREEAVVEHSRALGAGMLTGAAFATQPRQPVYIIRGY